MAQQMSFAEVGTLYNTISNELEGGVTPQNQTLLLNQVGTVQTQIQGLVDSGIFNNLIDDVGNPNPGAVVRAQNIADQMNFLKQEISAYGGSAFDPKYINDVVRDVQDIVGNDDNLAALAQQGGHSGFQQVEDKTGALLTTEREADQEIDQVQQRAERRKPEENPQ